MFPCVAMIYERQVPLQEDGDFVYRPGAGHRPQPVVRVRSLKFPIASDIRRHVLVGTLIRTSTFSDFGSIIYKPPPTVSDEFW